MNHHTSDITGRIRWGAIVIAAAATLAVGGHVAAGAGTSSPRMEAPADAQPTDPFHACLHAGPMTADRIEARTDECRTLTDALYADPKFIDCLRHAARTPDSMEHWADACQAATGR
jgi:hypothetical protein